MAEYVDRDKLPVRTINVGTPMFPRYISVVYADDIKSAPAADVAPVVRGRWVLIETGYAAKIYECSECKDDDYWKHHFAGGFEHFCPNCGARIDGE